VCVCEHVFACFGQSAGTDPLICIQEVCTRECVCVCDLCVRVCACVYVFFCFGQSAGTDPLIGTQEVCTRECVHLHACVVSVERLFEGTGLSWLCCFKVGQGFALCPLTSQLKDGTKPLKGAS